MITFSRLGNYGRLGNQLFQYAMLISLREKLGYEIKLPYLTERIWHGQTNLLNSFNIDYVILDSVDKIEHRFEEKNPHVYDESVFDIEKNTDIHGYFGHYKYFKEYSDLVKQELSPKISILEKSNQVIDNLRLKHEGFKIISLHIRRGDTDLSIYDSIYFDYLQKAKKEFESEKCLFLIFTGGSRTVDGTDYDDYNWCRKTFVSEEYIFLNPEENSAIFDFCTMICCDGHILSPTSTLSWWVGFLGRGKKVVAPKKYHYLTIEPSEGFYPENFILI
jgi:hypothetical protein